MKIIQAKQISPWRLEVYKKTQLLNPLVLVLGIVFIRKQEVLQDIRNEFPYEHLVFGSTSGEISGSSVNDDSVL
jgi:hypothetical protein